MPDEAKPDNRPFLAAGAVLVALAAAFAAPASRAWLVERVLQPLRAQADPTISARVGYSIPSLLVWAVVGAALAWAAYELVFVRLRYEPDRAFFLALSPYLVAGPLLHALLAARALPPASPLAYAATEPTIYLTTALAAVAALALGRATKRPLLVPAAVGGAIALALAVAAAPHVRPATLPRIGAVLALAAVPTAILAWAFHRLRPREPLDAVAAVVGAHALDGATTWMVLRDPFGLGSEGFSEKNPVSLALIQMSNGWPFFALKLALPLVLLWLVKPEAGSERTKAFLLFAIFVLGYGPGMANLLQVLLG